MSLESRTTFTSGYATIFFHAELRDRYGTPDSIADMNGRLTVEMTAEGDPVVSCSVYDGGVLSPSVREIIAREALRELKGDITILLAHAADTYTDPARATMAAAKKAASEQQAMVELVPGAVEACATANAAAALVEIAKAYADSKDPHGDGIAF